MNIDKFWTWLWNPPADAPRAVVLLRVMAGSVFLWEGIMKFVFPNLGVGRFMKLGFPFPGPTSAFTACLEIIGGIFFIAGWQTRTTALLFAIEMLVAVLSTKIPLYLGTYPLALPPAPPQIGFWAVLHEVRSEYAQMFVSIFLALAGPGPLSMDARCKAQKETRS